MLEEINTFTKVGPSHAYTGLVDTDKSSEQCGRYREVAEGQLHTLSDSALHLKPTPVDSEPKQPLRGFKQHHILIQLAMQVLHIKGVCGKHQTLQETTLPGRVPHDQTRINSDQGLSL